MLSKIIFENFFKCPCVDLVVKLFEVSSLCAQFTSYVHRKWEKIQNTYKNLNIICLLNKTTKVVGGQIKQTHIKMISNCQTMFTNRWEVGGALATN